MTVGCGGGQGATVLRRDGVLRDWLGGGGGWSCTTSGLCASRLAMWGKNKLALGFWGFFFLQLSTFLNGTKPNPNETKPK